MNKESDLSKKMEISSPKKLTNVNRLTDVKRVLVIGSGGREHAIADALRRSPQVSEIFCAPGNAGTAQIATNVAIKDTDVAGLLHFAQENHIGLTVVGPEAALAAGVVDAFRAAGLPIFGHTAAATRIESSKEFAKQLMEAHGIPSAAYRGFSNYDEAVAYVESRPLPAVLKYDGLAAGKGVVIAETLEESRNTLKDMLLDETFGEGKVIVEDYLTGPEFSFMAFVDGKNIFPMPLSQDHKRAFDGDKGPNTGGMGAYTSLPFISDADREFALEKILKPTAAAMCETGCPLSGVLYAGLMKTPNGIKVIEFNARFGDPETEVVLPLLQSDIYDIFYKIATGNSTQLTEPSWSEEVTMGVVLASKGYPGKYEKGFEIKGIENLQSIVYQMGTTFSDNKLKTSGGRVLMVIGKGVNLQSVRNDIYQEIEKIECDHLFYRHDIAHWAIEDGK